MKPARTGKSLSSPQCPITSNLSTEKKVSIQRSPGMQIIHGHVSNPFTQDVLDYLVSAESAEPDVNLRDDIRLAWLCVVRAAEGNPDPWRFAFWQMYGAVPEKVIPVWLERAEYNRLLDVPDYDPTIPVKGAKVDVRLLDEGAKLANGAAAAHVALRASRKRNRRMAGSLSPASASERATQHCIAESRQGNKGTERADSEVSGRSDGGSQLRAIDGSGNNPRSDELLAQLYRDCLKKPAQSVKSPHRKKA